MATYESAATTIDFDSLLKPISEENPVGEALQYSGIYDEIREARRSDDPSLSQGQWQTELKTSDFRQVITLSSNALSTQTKDLQIAVWLCEALCGVNGFGGLRDGVKLIRFLEENFWSALFPEIDEGDMEARANAMEWLDSQLSILVKKVPLTGGNGLDYIQWSDSTQFDFPENTENLSFEEKQKTDELRNQASVENRTTGEMWRNAKAATSRAFCETQFLTLHECLEEIAALDKKNEELFDRNQLPSIRNLKKSLEDIEIQVKKILEEKRIAEPDEIVESVIEETTGADGEPVSVKGATIVSGVIQNRQDALKRLSEVAEYFRKNEPHSPISYLIQRAVKWGDMPLESLLKDIIKDESIIFQLRQTLGFNTNSGEGNDL